MDSFFGSSSHGRLSVQECRLILTELHFHDGQVSQGRSATGIDL